MTLRSFLPGVALTAGTAAAVVLWASPAPERTAAAPSAAVMKAVQLAGDDRTRIAHPGLLPDAARALAVERAAAIPLPDGGNFSGVQWPTAPPTNPGELERVLQHNARCQWLRAQATGRQTAEAELVLAAAARWPAFVDEGPVAAAALLRQCLTSHAEEVRFAQSQGLTPTA